MLVAESDGGSTEPIRAAAKTMPWRCAVLGDSLPFPVEPATYLVCMIIGQRMSANGGGSQMTRPWLILFKILVLAVFIAGLVACSGGKQENVSPPEITDVLTPTLTTMPPSPSPAPTETPDPSIGTLLLVFGDRFIHDIYAEVRSAFEEAGYRVVVASRTMGPLQGKNVSLEVDVDLLLQDVRVEAYDGIVFTCDNDVTFGSARAETDRIAQEAVTQGKVLAAICSGPRVLAYAEVVEGLQTTGEPSQTCAMLEQSGATCTGAEVERDGLIITARDRDASHAFARQVIEALQEQSTAPSPRPGDEGLIAFVSTRDGNGEIYVMNADGSNQRRLTNWRLWDGFPDWSPDGIQIVYYSYLSDENWVIKTMDADGDEQGSSYARQLTDSGVCDGAPHWSPDGARITYDSGDCTGDQREVYVMDADGGNPRNLTNNETDDMLAAWSPDSTQLVFSSDRDGNYEIYVMDADGDEQGARHVRRLTENTAADHAPTWSPDGTQIAFYSERDGNAEVYVMDADGGNPRNLTNNPTEDWFPRWSPDGSQITFSSRRDGNLDIYVMNADGSDVRRLTDSPREDFNSVWQPRPANAQVDTWVKTYAGDPVWAALDGLETADGGYLLAGSTNYSHRNTRQEDVYLVKTDPAGEVVWAKAYGGDDFDRGNAVLQANDGGFVVLGETASSGAGDWDMLLLKVDADGNELWSKTFGGSAQERASAIQITADGGYILAGSTKSSGAGGSDLYLIKTDDLGNEIWSRTYGGELDEEANDVRHTSDGGFFVLAQALRSARLYTDQDPDIFLLKIDGTGNEIWSQVWEEENLEGGHALLPTSDGNYVIAGITSSAGSESDIDFLFLKIDAAGNLVWDRSIGDANAVDYGTDVIETPDGGYLFTGMFNGGGQGAIPLIKTDGSGQVLWNRNLIAGQGNKVGLRVIPTQDGAYVIVGNTDEYGRGFETVLIKIKDAGSGTEEAR